MFVYYDYDDDEDDGDDDNNANANNYNSLDGVRFFNFNIIPIVDENHFE